MEVSEKKRESNSSSDLQMEQQFHSANTCVRFIHRPGIPCLIATNGYCHVVHLPIVPLLFFFITTESSGGALFHHAGFLNLDGGNFTGNMAGSEGLAVVTFGSLELSYDFPLVFANNSFYCPAGQYGFERVYPQVRHRAPRRPDTVSLGSKVHSGACF